MSIYRNVAAALTEADSSGEFEQAAERILPIIGTPDSLLDFTRCSVREGGGRNPTAYMHSNGFLKVEYFRSQATGLRVRAHFWNPAWGAVRQNPHNHAFDFRSRIVLGTFNHRQFSKVDEGAGRFHFGYRYTRAMRTDVDSYRLEKAAPAWLQERMSARISAGAEYLMRGDQLHALDPTEGSPGATAVVSRPNNDQPWSEVYSMDDVLDLMPRNARLLDLATMVECVETVLTAKCD